MNRIKDAKIHSQGIRENKNYPERKERLRIELLEDESICVGLRTESSLV